MMEEVVPTGTIRKIMLQSYHYHQPNRRPIFYRPDVLPVAQLCQSTEVYGKKNKSSNKQITVVRLTEVCHQQ